MRMAVNTGEVLVSLERAPRLAPSEGLVAGDVVNTASRLQDAAPVNEHPRRRGDHNGRPTARSSTARTASRRSEGQVGADARLGGSRGAVALRRRRGARAGTPLVGRERELDLLRAAFARARHERSPQLVTLIGVPGIGKTRLVCRSSSARSKADPELIYWRQGRCLPYGEGVAFWALGEIVKAHAGILEGEPAEAASLEAGRRRPRGDRRTNATRPGSSASCAAAGVGRRRRGARRPWTRRFAAWRRFFEALAEPKPARARLRGPPLGGRGVARLRRPPRRLGGRSAAPGRRRCAPRAADAPAQLGRR